MKATSVRRGSKTIRNRLGVLALIFTLAFVYYKVSLHNFSWYANKDKSPCKTPENEMRDLLSLAKDTSLVLKSMDVTHFLIYGSLWGGLRYNGPLPWDNDFDFGVLYNEIFKHPKQELINRFKHYGIDCYYSQWFGFFRVTRSSARGDIMVFQDFYNTGWMHRIGWESYVFFVNYRNYHKFPAYLVKLPLEHNPFGLVNVSVPHNTVEIQRYHYPYDWWKIERPNGCQSFAKLQSDRL